MLVLMCMLIFSLRNMVTQVVVILTMLRFNILYYKKENEAAAYQAKLQFKQLLKGAKGIKYLR